MPPPAWFGWLPAHFGPLWKEERTLEKAEERWPNGNLKAVGQRMHGHEYGEWHYFNEEGDRVKIVTYTGNLGTRRCDPNGPENKGAGKQR